MLFERRKKALHAEYTATILSGILHCISGIDVPSFDDCLKPQNYNSDSAKKIMDDLKSKIAKLRGRGRHNGSI